MFSATFFNPPHAQGGKWPSEWKALWHHGVGGDRVELGGALKVTFLIYYIPSLQRTVPSRAVQCYCHRDQSVSVHAVRAHDTINHWGVCGSLETDWAAMVTGANPTMAPAEGQAKWILLVRGLCPSNTPERSVLKREKGNFSEGAGVGPQALLFGAILK